MIKMKVLSEMDLYLITQKVYENFISVDGKDCIQKDVLMQLVQNGQYGYEVIETECKSINIEEFKEVGSGYSEADLAKKIHDSLPQLSRSNASNGRLWYSLLFDLSEVNWNATCLIKRLNHGESLITKRT